VLALRYTCVRAKAKKIDQSTITRPCASLDNSLESRLAPNQMRQTASLSVTPPLSTD